LDSDLTKEQEMIRKEGCIRAGFSIRKPLFEQANALAYEMEISRSRLFAMAVEDFIRQHKHHQESTDDDPLLQLAGVFESDITDICERHDEYIGEALRK
jgi:metal-responsive CopG/Arc/MetJ family transcriptional regulator